VRYLIEESQGLAQQPEQSDIDRSSKYLENDE